MRKNLNGRWNEDPKRSFFKDFGIKDERGRTVGAIVTVTTPTVCEAGEWQGHMDELDPFEIGDTIVYLDIQASRNGKPFGPSPRTFFAGGDDDPETDRRLQDEIDRRLKSMEKRYRKQFGRSVS